MGLAELLAGRGFATSADRPSITTIQKLNNLRLVTATCTLWLLALSLMPPPLYWPESYDVYPGSQRFLAAWRS